MAKVLIWLQKYQNYIVIAISILAFSTLFMPLFTISNYNPPYTFIILNSLKDHSPWFIIVSMISALAIALSFLFSMRFKHFIIVPEFLNSLVSFVVMDQCFRSWDSMYHAHSGLILAVIIFALSLFTLFFSIYKQDKTVPPKLPNQPKPKKEKPLKQAERVEILELKLKIAELEKELQQKDGH